MMELESLIINPAAQGTSVRKKKIEKTRIASCGSRSQKYNSRPRLEGNRKGAGFYLPIASFDPPEVNDSNLASKSYQEEGGVEDHESYRHRNSDSDDSDDSDQEDDHHDTQHPQHFLPSTHTIIKSSLSHFLSIIPNSIFPSNEMTTAPPYAQGEEETTLKDKNSTYFDGDVGSVDSDAVKLAKMGYTQDLERNFSKWSLLGVSFALTNSWFGISASLVTGINSGGPVVTVYGIILIALINGCAGISLAELVSAMPNSGGQYYWVSVLAPPRHMKFLSYLTGAVGYAGSIFTCASVALAIGSALMGMIQMNHPDLVIERWMVFVAYQIFNLFAWVFNCYGKTLPRVASFFLYVSLTSFIVITITVLATSSPKQNAKFVFANFVNNTGWESNAIAFIVGLINPNWSFACLDSATHLAEEVPRPESNIPFAIMGTVAIGFVTAFLYSIAMFFSMTNLDELVNTATLVPILELYRQATGSKPAAIFLEFLICFTGLGCQIACHTWQARLCWSFARDKGLPGSRYWSQVHPTMGIPFHAHTMSCIVVALLGLLYIGSTTAFNSMVTACIVLLYISYAIPVILLLMKGRNNIKHGPFWVGKLGLVANLVLLFWTGFTLIMYSFPYSMPVTSGTMNYVSAVYGVVFILTIGYWFARGKHTFRGGSERAAEAEHIVREVASHAHAN
ncbi:amino acid permease-domain-containing protein [Tuber brumale]|nr:amino acid permease-domain-containing protein [Tuber brumale]